MCDVRIRTKDRPDKMNFITIVYYINTYGMKVELHQVLAVWPCTPV